MVSLVSPALLNLAGLPALPLEPHVQSGNHLRISHHPLLGLPVAPFILQRLTLGGRGPVVAGPAASPAALLRRDAVFRNRAGQVLSLPITLSKGEEIRATMAQSGEATCIWVGMVAAEAPVVVRPGLNLAGVNLGGSIVTGPRITDTIAKLDPVKLRDLFDNRANSLKDLLPRKTALRMQAYGSAMAGAPALLAERRAAPYLIAAPAIAEVVITGTGVITDFAWLAAQDLNAGAWESIAVLNLPRKPGLRYLSVSDARDRAEAALRAQAPKLSPLQETSGATPPAAAPAFSPALESDRVHDLAWPLDGDLDALIDSATPPLLAVETLALTDAAGQPLAQGPGEQSEVSISHLARVLQGSLDPGVAAWLGYKGYDKDYGQNEGMTLYRVLGFFRNPLAIGARPEQLLTLPLAQIPAADRSLGDGEVAKLVTTFAAPVLRPEGRQIEGALEAASDYIAIAAIAAVDRSAPPAPPAPPVMLAPEHVSWLPEVPPIARREVECPVKGVLTGATLAAEREQPPGSFNPINRKTAGGWHLPLTLGLNGGNSGALLADQDGRQGFVADRLAGPEAARYHIAQQDRFGRWSGFAAQDAAAGPRPKPPRPVLQGNYLQPAPADAGITGGTLKLRVPMPEADALAPGSYPLSHLRFSFAHEGVAPPSGSVALPDQTAPVSAAVAIDSPPAGTAPRRAVPLVLTGPVLQPTEQRRMIVTAVWVDSFGQISAPSEPLRLMMTDPRPPAQLSIPDVLLYSARPDATGLAYVERRWPVPANPPSYAVYYTDEIRLLSWLTESGRAPEAQAIAATADRAARAGKLRAIQQDFPDHLFERLADAVEPVGTGERRFRHALSGSTRVLNGYKIAVEAPISGARPDLAALDTVFYGVPNSDPPPRPMVDLRMVAPLPGEPALVAEVTVSVMPGVTPARTARIYRTRGGPTDPLSAPVVGTIALPAPDPVTGRQVASFRDIGTAEIAPTARLTPYARYQWFADVQGAPESGSAVPGLWSQPSDPKSLATVPALLPQAPSLTCSGTPAAGGYRALAVHVTHPLGPAPTMLGYWRYDLARAEPGAAWVALASGEVQTLPLAITDPEPTGLTLLGSRLRLTLTDPIGRPLPAVELVVT
ncbi:hypothetical protein [Paracoccus aminophilus]|uniref:Uncharacterized protein n=1 Tax=Paracoccus aminophilus JCM 7686 TaxID=1367847 RepID=S5YHY4_PARAH|nr:hypothetical protein [Paracoccus aminophilus]AGT11058.1 hypothetical protein JCM7686_pAMI4p374 [Paracoccus aminophilus JCM 7686]